MTNNSQHMRALARANEVRYARADMKRELGAIGPMSASCRALADALELSDPESPGYAAYLHKVTCLEYLKWGRSVGVTRAKQILEQAVVGPTRTIGDLTRRERTSLASALRAVAVKSDPSAAITWAEQVTEAIEQAR